MTQSQTLEYPVGVAPRYSTIIGRPIDNTVLSTYMRCPHEAVLAYWMHRRKDGARSPSLAYGTTWHAGMEAHFKAPKCSKEDLVDIVRLKMAESWEDHGIIDDIRTFERCFLEYKKFLDRMGLPWDEEYRTVGWPENPMVEMSAEVPIPGARHPYTVKIDRLAETGPRGNPFFYVDDHKTASQEDKNFFSQFNLDNQMMGYAVGGQLLTKRIITGVRIRRHVIRKNDSVFDHQSITYSQVRLLAWCANYDLWLDRLERDLQKWQELTAIFIQKGMSEVEAQSQAADVAFPLNKWACHGRKYGSCSNIGVCALPPDLRHRAIEDDFPISVWNPLNTVDTDV